MTIPNGPQLEQVKQAILAGRKIEAIKLHREATGLGLKESKEAVEQLETELRRTTPDRFSQAPVKSGCFPALLFGVGFAIATWAVFLR